MRGSDPIQIQTPPVVQVSLTLAVSIDDFFVQNLISNLAYVLNINPSTIRVVQIIAESAPFTGKKSLLAVNDTTLTLELGVPPPNTTAVPITPSVGAKLATSGGQRSVDVVVSSINHYPELFDFVIFHGVRLVVYIIILLMFYVIWTVISPP